MYLGDIYIFQLSVLFGISVFMYASDNSQLNRRSGEKGRKLPPSSGWQKFPPSASAVEPRVNINDQHTNFQFGKFLWIINVNN
jgi:hypothetical protein